MTTIVSKAMQPPKTRATERRELLRENLWPGLSTELWNRKKEKGFCTIPRTLSLIMTLIDILAEKGKDASHVYLDLWCRAFDDYLLEVSDEEPFAYSSGYSSVGRNVRTWRERVRVLESLGFVHVKAIGSRKFGYILLPDPHKVVKKLHAKGNVPDNWWGAYTKRASDIGCVLP